MLPPSLVQNLGQPMPGIARITLTTRAGTRFRTLVLLEALFVLGTVVLLIPVVIAALLSMLGGVGGGDDGGGSGGGSSSTSDFDLAPGERHAIRAFLTSRFTLPTLATFVEVQGEHGEALWSGDVELDNPDGYDALLGSLLRIGRLQQVPVEECLRVRRVAERVGLFHPQLLGRRSIETVEQARAALGEDCTLERSAEGWTLQLVDTGRVGAIRFVLMAIISPLAVLIVPRQVREVLVEGWRDLRGVAPRTTTVTMRAHSLRVRVTRGRRVELDQVVRASRLQAFDTAPRITREPALVLYGPVVRVLHESGVIRLPAAAPHGTGVERTLTACMRDLWDQVPEASPTADAGQVRCRGCERRAPFEPGRNCPWCGGVFELQDVPL